MSEDKKHALGHYSKFVYPLWFLGLVSMILYFEELRQDNWARAFGGGAIPNPEVVQGHNDIMVAFLTWFVVLWAVPFLWHYFVSRDKKKYPEKYRKY